jgi:hypothetical protein
MVATLIKATGADLGGGNATAAAVSNIQAQFNSTPVTQALPPQQVDTRVNPPASSGGAIEVRDRYGNLWIYNSPDAPECARGKMVLKHGTAQATGKPYKGWFDPAAGPHWTGAKIPKEEQATTIWA